jgi:hypothetical protein
MNNKTYSNPTSQAQRAEVLKNDARVNTYHGRMMLELEMEMQGRFAKPTQVVAGAGAPTYPKAAAWSTECVPPEPPLGIADVAPVVGELHEVRADQHRARVRRADIAAQPQGDGRDDSASATPAERKAGGLVSTPGLPANQIENVMRRLIRRLPSE